MTSPTKHKSWPIRASFLIGMCEAGGLAYIYIIFRTGVYFWFKRIVHYSSTSIFVSEESLTKSTRSRKLFIRGPGAYETAKFSQMPRTRQAQRFARTWQPPTPSCDTTQKSCSIDAPAFLVKRAEGKGHHMIPHDFRSGNHSFGMTAAWQMTAI